jgi:aryl-alcohol dehydrogenase-like predicted oxidoreductase
VEYRNVGRSGLRVSQVALGTMTWAHRTDEDAAAAQLAAFRTAGGTLIDTAASYGAGRAEEILGTVLSGMTRDEFVLASKGGAGGAASVDASRGALLRDLDGSLRRLKVDYLDLWQVHSVDRRVPFEETMSALDTAVAAGKARYVGVSNYSGWQLAQAATWQQAAPARAPLVSVQVEYSLLSRGIEREVVPAGQALGIGLLAYSPLGGGVLTGKYRDAVPADSRAVTLGRSLADYIDVRSVGIVEAVATAAEGLATSASAVALSWLLGRPGVASGIVGARTLPQLMTSLHGVQMDLPIEIRDALDDVSATERTYPDAVE